MENNNFRIVVLAAGLGKRMGNPDGLPKVLTPLKGKPMIGYLLQAIQDSGVDDKPILVIGSGADLVRQTFGQSCDYVLQEQQLGTGHAVKTAKPALAGAENVMVLYGDHPLVSAELIKNLADKHLASGGVLTMATVTVPDFNGWHAEFASFAKIIRDADGRVAAVVEKKDASAEQADIKEVNPAYMCFNAGWLWQNLEKVGNVNAQGEYYLTDLVKMAVVQGHEIQTVDIADVKEALGVNTKEQLAEIEHLL